MVESISEIIYSGEEQLKVAQQLKRAIRDYIAKTRVEGGKDFFVKHTRQMDHFLTGIYKYLLLQTFREFQPPIATIPIVIVALGSYGREQLSIYSDIDIMIVYEEIPGYNLIQLIERFIQMVWDLGLQVGHRVHSLSQLKEAALSDWSIYSAFLDSRFITGSKYLWTIVEGYLNQIRKDETGKRKFLNYLYHYYLERHHSRPISMEPDIKNGAGGIRDANTLYWSVKVLYNYPSTRYLVPEYMGEEEYKLYRSSLEYLFKVRVFLHLVAKGKEERVRLEYQREIALKMGYSDSPRLKRERKFIRELLAHLWRISTFSHILLRKLIKGYLRHCPLEKIKKGRIAPGFTLIDGKLNATFTPHLPPEKRWKVVLKHQFNSGDISVVAQLKGVKLSSLQLIPLFTSPITYSKLILLYRSDKIEEIVPPFKRIKHLAQFDGYHHYPVDIHTLYTIKEVEDLFNSSDPIISQIVDSLSPKERLILKLGALFHDMGKGYKGDHSFIGAKIVRTFLNRLGVEEMVVEGVYHLVKHHTDLSYTAHREDIYNDRTLFRFATKIKTATYLKLLYLLTLADTKGVGPGVLTDFKRRLLTTLYFNTMELFQNPTLLTEEEKRLRKERLLQRDNRFLALPFQIRKGILTSPSTQLFLQNSVSKIGELGEWIFEQLVKQEKNYHFRLNRERFLTIEIIKKTPFQFALGWFIDKLYRLDLKHLSIYRIGKFKYFRLEFEQNLENWYGEEAVIEWIKTGFKGIKPLQKRIAIPKTALQIECNHSLNSALVKVEMEDQKGIVSTILQVFDRLKVWVEDVKITTIRGIALDLFIVSKEEGFCRKIENLINQLSNPPQ